MSAFEMGQNILSLPRGKGQRVLGVWFLAKKIAVTGIPGGSDGLEVVIKDENKAELGNG